ncbi:MAG TPA: hypothetical protein VJ011_00980 [Steroidobacteraceae bacterium]|nr:hypothetical protein [Steroidobacteraceae bacterium]
MTVALIGSLSALALYLAKRWRDSKVENADLRSQIATLKRQLTRHGRVR